MNALTPMRPDASIADAYDRRAVAAHDYYLKCRRPPVEQLTEELAEYLARPRDSNVRREIRSVARLLKGAEMDRRVREQAQSAAYWARNRMMVEK